jgi:hypothetical protein
MRAPYLLTTISAYTHDYESFINNLEKMKIGYWEIVLVPGKHLVNFTNPSGHDIKVCEAHFKG